MVVVLMLRCPSRSAISLRLAARGLDEVMVIFLDQIGQARRTG